MSRAIDRQAWASYLGGTACFGDLPTGARFVFAQDKTQTLLIKAAGAWYRNAETGARFKTGAGAAVAEVHP